MTTHPIVADSPRYVLTEDGREALRARETCECQPRPDGGYMVCARCGTVWKLDTYGRGVQHWREK